MLNRVVAVALLACLLGGCTDADWDHTLSYVGLDQGQSQNAPVKPVSTNVASAANTTSDSSTTPVVRADSWCETAAVSAARDARENGFDDATQRRQADLARTQCLHQ